MIYSNLHRAWRIFLSGVLLATVSMNGSAQRNVLAKSFYGLGNTDAFQTVGNISGFDGWEFDHCYVSKVKNMQVGSGSNPYTEGSFTTKPLGLYGNAILLIKAARIDDKPATMRISVIDGGSINTTDFAIPSGTTYRPSAILIRGCTTATRIKVESVSSKLYIQAIKVYEIEDAIFYESFNYMDGTGGNDGNFSAGASLVNKDNDFDYSSGVSYKDIHECSQCIEMNASDNYYTTPVISTSPEEKMMLSFRIAGTRNHAGDNMEVTLNGGGTLSATSFEVDKENWKTCYAVISNATASTTITFKSVYCFLDDVKVTLIPSGLGQTKDNTTYIVANADQVRDVTLTRTITQNVWCPLCLPFDVTPALINTSFGETCEVRTLGAINTTTGVFTFNSIDENATIAAGIPFLVKSASEVVDPTFSGVTIKDTPAAEIANGDYKFKGNYSPTYLETDGTHLFLGIDGNLYQPGSEDGYNRLGGLRAFFVVPKSADARVTITDEPAETTSVEMIKTNSDLESYDLSGRVQKHSKLIIRNGRKIMKK